MLYFQFMKKIILLLLLAQSLFMTVTAQNAGEQKGWPSSERYAFLRECIKEAGKNMSADSARFYCYCMQAKVEEKYPTVEAASKITEEDMNGPAFQKDIQACLGGYWNTETRELFLTNCTGTAKQEGLEADKAKNYCECMLFKIEVRYPDPKDADKLTADMLKTAEWQKIVKGCLDF